MWPENGMSLCHDVCSSYRYSLLPQVQRIYEYHRLLVQLFSITSKDHPDYEDLRHTVARVQHVSLLLHLHSPSPSSHLSLHCFSTSLYLPFSFLPLHSSLLLSLTPSLLPSLTLLTSPSLPHTAYFSFPSLLTPLFPPSHSSLLSPFLPHTPSLPPSLPPSLSSSPRWFSLGSTR